MRFSRLCVTAALPALASPAAAQKKPANGCELLPQYDALASAHTKINNSFMERGKVILAQKPISRDDVILMNAFLDAHSALAALQIEILKRLGPNCLPNRDKMIAVAREAQEQAQTQRLPVPPPKPGDGSALPSNVAPSTKSADPVSPPVGVASDPVVKTMDAIDFLVDGKEMVGKRVTVTGCSIQVVANLVTCQVPVGFFWVDRDSLSKEDLRQSMRQCSPTSPCPADITGVVDTWADGLTLRQGKIAWKQ